MRALCSLALASSNLVHVDVEVVPEEISEHLRGAEFEEELGHVGCEVRLGLHARNLQPLDLADRQILEHHGFLGQRVDEPSRDDLDLIYVALQEQVTGERGNRPRLGEPR